MSDIVSLGAIAAPDIPVIKTDRLTLRGHTISDLDPLSSIWAKPDTFRFIGKKLRTRQDIWQQIQRSVGGWALQGYGYWVVELSESRQVIGEVGFMEGLRELHVNFAHAPEAGWVIDPAHWGNGFANEALRAAFRWRDTMIEFSRTICMVEAHHVTSIHLAKKFEFNPFAEVEIDGAPITLFERFA